SSGGGGGVTFSFGGEGEGEGGPGNNGTTSASSGLPHPQYYDSLYRAVAVTLSSLVFTIGFVGNILVVIVIARTRSMHTTTNCYLLSLAVADCLVLLSATLPAVPETFFRIDEWPFGRALCSLLIYLQYVGVDASSLSITAFTIERYIAICHPIRAQTICTVSRAKKIIGGIWLFTLLYCGPWLGLTDLNETRLSDGTSITKCMFRLQRSSYLTLYMIDLVVFYIIPFFITTVLYCLIGRILVLTSFRHAQDRRSTRSPMDRGGSGSSAEQKKKTSSSVDVTRHVIRMLVVVVVVFATLWMPYRVMVVYNSFAQHKVIDLWFLMFSRTLIYINCAINPILYNLMSVKFRRAFKNLLCCGQTGTRADRCAPKRPNTGEGGLRPAGPPVYLYSEMWTEGSNVKRHTFNARRPPSPPTTTKDSKASDTAATDDVPLPLTLP
ncbi:thyrotropin-releasing hormone receptor-like, partial [Babylonia areolata]|uniref:thyrotropin-releasing hormone receptor-like n=1 Tax=Babylonia areolata TaxID=304850 RepID=UPI003FD2FDD2